MWTVKIRWLVAGETPAQIKGVEVGEFGPFSERAQAEQAMLMAIQRGALSATIEEVKTP